MRSGFPRLGDAAPHAKVPARCARTGFAHDLKRTYAYYMRLNVYSSQRHAAGTHHGIFSLGFASQSLVYRLINEVQYAKG